VPIDSTRSLHARDATKPTMAATLSGVWHSPPLGQSIAASPLNGDETWRSDALSAVRLGLPTVD